MKNMNFTVATFILKINQYGVDCKRAIVAFFETAPRYTRKNAQVVTSLQTSCYTSVHKLSTSCARTACSQFVVTSLEQAVNNL
jgi:hypothetical protein